MRIIGNFIYHLAAGILLAINLVIVLLHVFEPDLQKGFLASLQPYVQAEFDVEHIEASLLSDFPKASITLTNLRIKETGTAPAKDAYVIGKAVIKFNYTDIFKGDWRVREVWVVDAQLHWVIDENGEPNYVFWPEDSVDQNSSQLAFALDKVHVSNCDFTFLNKTTVFGVRTTINKGVFGVLSDGEKTNLAVNAGFTVHDLHSGEITLLENKSLSSTLGFTIQDAETYVINNGKLNVEGMQFSVDGTIDNSSQDVVTNLDIEGTQTELKDFVALSPGLLRGALSDYTIEGGAFFNAKIRGAWKQSQAAGLLVGFGIRNGTIKQQSTGLSFSAINLEGSFSNGKERSNASSILRLRNISAREHNKALSGELELRNFDNPWLDFAIKADLDLQRIHHIFPLPQVQEIQGEVAADIAFNGNLSDLEDPESLHNTDFNGQVELKDIQVESPLFASPWQGINGILSFEKPFLMLNGVKAQLGSSDFGIEGFVKNPFGFLANKQRLAIMADVSCKTLHVNDFLPDADTDVDSLGNADLSSWPDYFLANVNLDIAQLQYGKLRAKNTKAKIKYWPGSIEFQNAQMETMEGQVRLQGIVKEALPDGYDVLAHVETEGVNIKTVFQDLENFDQAYITASHLEGSLTSAMNFSFETGSDFSIIPATVVADVDVEVVNGELIDFLPMMQVARFIKVGHFEHIVFDTLQNHFFVANETIEVPQMDIVSNTLDMTISGTHTFDNQVNYRARVALKKLFMNRHALSPANFTKLEKAIGGGMQVYLLITGSGDNPDIAYDVMAVGENLGENVKEEIAELEEARKKEQALRARRQDSMAQIHRRMQKLRRKKAYKQAITK